MGIVAAFVVAMPSLFLAAPASAEGDMWTVMVYMDGDNNLESATVTDLREMMMAGSTAEVNIVVLVDTLSGPADLVYVNQGSTTLLEAWGEVNMADPVTLQTFITRAVALYPAENYVLDFWDHGGGIMGVCWDDTSNSDKLTMTELRSAIVNAGVAIDVVLFDACDMAQAEIAHQFVGYSDYIVFSQETMWGYGFPYDTILAGLVATPTMTDRDFAVMVGEEFTVFYGALGWNTCTISVYDMAYLTTVSNAVGAFASGMKATMSTTYKTYKSCRLATEDAAGAADLMGFAKLVSANAKVSTDVRNAAAAVVSAVDMAIIYEWHSKDCNGMNGLGIWFPTSSVSYYWSSTVETMYRSMPFDAATHWADFLDSYYDKG